MFLFSFLYFVGRSIDSNLSLTFSGGLFLCRMKYVSKKKLYWSDDKILTLLCATKVLWQESC